MSNPGLRSVNCYDRRLEAQKATVSSLREALDQQKTEQELLPLVQTCYAQYKECVDAKIRAMQEDASLMASSAWKSPLEAGFLWVGGWRPTTAVVLAYSLMGMQIESELWKILEGMDVPSMAALSAWQLLRLNSLHMQNRAAEDDLSDRLALLQMLVADQQMVKATTADPPPSETNDLSEVREAMEPKLASLRNLTVEAEQLRSQTVHEMLKILTATQAAQFIVASFEMFLALKKLGEDQYGLDSGGSEELNLKRDANVTELASQGEYSKLQEAFQHGADPSEVDYDGRTPLHVAAEKGHVDCVALLVKAGANVNQKDKFGMTPLIGALRGNHDAVAQILVQSGAEAQMEEPGIELCKATATGDVEYLERLVSHGVDPNAVDYTQLTPLHIAAATGVSHAVELLVSKGADVLAKNWHGSTPLDEAKHSESEETVKILEEQMLARCQHSNESHSIEEKANKDAGS